MKLHNTTEYEQVTHYNHVQYIKVSVSVEKVQQVMPPPLQWNQDLAFNVYNNTSPFFQAIGANTIIRKYKPIVIVHIFIFTSHNTPYMFSLKLCSGQRPHCLTILMKSYEMLLLCPLLKEDLNTPLRFIARTGSCLSCEQSKSNHNTLPTCLLQDANAL